MAHLISRRVALYGLAGISLAACSERDSGTAITEESGYADVPGGKVWWMRAGSGSKTPLLLLHGGPGAGHNYLLSMKALANERPVIFYDQLGCGRSDSPDDDALYTVTRAVEEVDAVRKALGLDRIVLFGNSWGAMLAIEYFATRGGPGVEKLVLSGAYASTPQVLVGLKRLLDGLPDGGGARIEALESAGQQQSSEYQSLVQAFYERHLCRALPWPPDVLTTIENISKSPAYRAMWGPNEFTIVGNLKDWERRANLGAIRVPTLLTTGQYDEVTLDCHQTILEGVPGSQLLVFEGCSHLTMAEKPAEYSRAVRAFIA
jgi:proline iminopeptidase